MKNRKPYNNRTGYISSRKCKLGGHVVTYDVKRGYSEVTSNYRWIVRHEPSGLFLSAKTKRDAYNIMKRAAAGFVIELDPNENQIQKVEKIEAPETDDRYVAFFAGQSEDDARCEAVIPHEKYRLETYSRFMNEYDDAGYKQFFVVTGEQEIGSRILRSWVR